MRNNSDVDKERFTENIIYELSQFNPPIVNVNDYANSLINFLYMIFNIFFPIKSKTVSEKRVNISWITPDIKCCIDKKHIWYNLMKKIS